MLAVVDIVQDEPAGRERHRHRGVSPVVGAVQEICVHGAVLHMLHVRGADGMDVDIGLAPIAKDTLYVPPRPVEREDRPTSAPSQAEARRRQIIRRAKLRGPGAARGAGAGRTAETEKGGHGRGKGDARVALACGGPCQ